MPPIGGIEAIYLAAIYAFTYHCSGKRMSPLPFGTLRISRGIALCRTNAACVRVCA